MKAIILDPIIYKKAKQIADQVYDRPSAYKSGFIVKKYKEMGGRYSDDVPKQKTDLKRWFNEKWSDINPYKDEQTYPVYRPTKRVNKKTPLILSEIDMDNLKKQSKLKQTYRHTKKLPPFIKKQ
jgi:hypothetical protein